MPDLSAYRLTQPVVPTEGPTVALVHDACPGVEIRMEDPSVTTVLKHITIHEVCHHPRPKQDFRLVATNPYEPGKPTGPYRRVEVTKPKAPYPLDEETHDPATHCRSPHCKDTNWGGHDRLHSRGSECPPDQGFVADGLRRDRERYRTGD